MRERRPARSPRRVGAQPPVPSTLWASGTEPIDLTHVWPTPILARTITEFSQPGDDVWLLPEPNLQHRTGSSRWQPGPTPQNDAALTFIHQTGRHARLITPEPHPGDKARSESPALVVASLLPEHPDAEMIAEAMAFAADQLRAGGVLVVFTRASHTPDSVLCDATGPVVSAAQSADLLYLGHIVAATHHRRHHHRRTPRPRIRPRRRRRLTQAQGGARRRLRVPATPLRPPRNQPRRRINRPRPVPPLRRPPQKDTPAVNNTPQTNTPDHGPDSAPVSVWATAQTAPATQRAGRYHPDATAHPAKMLPNVAAHAINHYTQPGDLVLDPMCGIGTSIIEALYLERRAIGVEYETRWADLARNNIDLARTAGHTCDATVYTGDARKLGSLLPKEYLRAVDLVITSPPYGDSVHGHIRTLPGQGVHKYDHRYGHILDRGNLANLGIGRLLSGFTRILTSTAPYLKPGGHIVITARPWRQHAELVDLPAHIITCGTLAGLEPVERCVALLGRLADGDLIARSSFFQRDFITKNRTAGLPLHLIAHEDVIILRNPEKSRSSLELKRSQRALQLGPVSSRGDGERRDSSAA